MKLSTTVRSLQEQAVKMTQDYHLSLDIDAVINAVQAVRSASSASSSSSSSSSSSASSASSSSSSSHHSSANDDSGPRITILVNIPIHSWEARFELDPPPPYSPLPPSQGPHPQTSTETTSSGATNPAPASSSSREQLPDVTSDGGDENRDSGRQSRRTTALGGEMHEFMPDCETPPESPRCPVVGLGQVARPPPYQHPPAYVYAESLSVKFSEPSSPSPSWVQALEDVGDADTPPPPPPAYAFANPQPITATVPSSPSPLWVQVLDEAESEDGGVRLSWSVYSRSSRTRAVYEPDRASLTSSASSRTLNELDVFDGEAVGAEHHPLTTLPSSLEVFGSHHAISSTSLLELLQSQHATMLAASVDLMQLQHATMLAASLEALGVHHGQESRSHRPSHAPVVNRRQRLWRRIRGVFRSLGCF